MVIYIFRHASCQPICASGDYEERPHMSTENGYGAEKPYKSVLAVEPRLKGLVQAHKAFAGKHARQGTSDQASSLATAQTV